MSFILAIVLIILAFIIGVIGGASILWLIVVKNKDFFLKLLGGTEAIDLSGLKDELVAYIKSLFDEKETIAYDDTAITEKVASLEEKVTQLTSYIDKLIAFGESIKSSKEEETEEATEENNG